MPRAYGEMCRLTGIFIAQADIKETKHTVGSTELNILIGAGTGALEGFMLGGPVGAAIGAVVGGLLGACALITVLTTVGIAAVLLYESFAFFSEVSPIAFLTDTKWTAQIDGEHYGILTLFSGTLLITVIAAVVALPLGLAAACLVVGTS